MDSGKTNLGQIDVTVVIPTTGRDTLDRAISSAFDQELQPAQIIVVANGSSGVNSKYVEHPRVEFMHTIEANANAARQLGIESAQTHLIALLDDDDVWRPEKLRRQIDFAQREELVGRPYWIIGCGTIEVNARGQRRMPRQFSDEERRINPAEYLFTRRWGRSPLRQLQTSTLLFPRELGIAVPFDAKNALHQDWAWAISASERGASVHIVSDWVVEYRNDGPEGITKNTKAAASEAWARDSLASASRRVQGDFLLTISARFASVAGDIGQMFQILGAALGISKPGLPAKTIFLLNVLRAMRVRMSK